MVDGIERPSDSEIIDGARRAIEGPTSPGLQKSPVRFFVLPLVLKQKGDRPDGEATEGWSVVQAVGEGRFGSGGGSCGGGMRPLRGEEAASWGLSAVAAGGAAVGQGAQC